MQRYIDTSALIALISARDSNHEAATEFFSQVVEIGGRFIVGRPVLIEFLDGVTKRVAKRDAVRYLDQFQSSKVYRIEHETDEDHRRAEALFRKYADQEVDLTDSLSFAIAERLGIKEVFGFDSDFAVHGFTVRPE